MKKVLCVLLAAVIACSAVSCSQTSEENNGSDPTVYSTESGGENIEDETRLHDSVPEMDLGGDSVVFLVQPNDSNGYWGQFEFYTEEMNGVVLNDAIFNRNNTINDRFNITIEQITDTSWVSMMNNSIAAGMDEYDIVPLLISQAGSSAAGGVLHDFNDLEYIDFDKPWWDPVLNDCISVAGKKCVAFGAITLMDKEATYIMMFNKDVTADYSLGNLYDLFREDKWTFDKEMELCETVTRDIDGNGIYTFDDCVGLVTDDGATYQAIFYSAGCGYFEKDENDVPFFSVDMDKAVTTAEMIFKVVEADSTMMASKLSSQGIGNPWSDQGLNGMFKQGRALFYGISLTVMSKMRDMDSDFGVLPYPKINENQQEYQSFLHTIGDSLCVPITVADPVALSAVIEAMCCESMYTTLPAYYDVTVTNKTVRDAESAEILDYIFDHRHLDLSEVYNWGNLYNMMNNVRGANNFASTLQKFEKMANREMEKTLEQFKNGN